MDANNIIFLMGAGASVEATIPMSNEMVRRIEVLVESDPEWKVYKDLYFFLRSSIIYSRGILGEKDYYFNVEDLLVIIDELEKREQNLMYAFIGSWNTRLIDVAGRDFKYLSDFKKMIRRQLLNWVKPETGYLEDASYYSGFNILQSHFAEPMRVFTLNYDLCFERIVGKDGAEIEQGFENRIWNYKKFESQHFPPNFYLYKLHGSINWLKEDQKLRTVDDPIDNAELIFGLSNKLTSIDPYYYYTSEFRRHLFNNNTKLLVAIGYSYSDEYINQFISQALKVNSDLSVLNVTYCHNEEASNVEMLRIISLLDTEKERLNIEYQGASKFLLQNMNEDYLNDKLKRDDLPF